MCELDLFYTALTPASQIGTAEEKVSMAWQTGNSSFGQLIDPSAQSFPPTFRRGGTSLLWCGWYCGSLHGISSAGRAHEACPTHHLMPALSVVHSRDGAVPFTPSPVGPSCHSCSGFVPCRSHFLRTMRAEYGATMLISVVAVALLLLLLIALPPPLMLMLPSVLFGDDFCS